MSQMEIEHSALILNHLAQTYGDSTTVLCHYPEERWFHNALINVDRAGVHHGILTDHTEF